MPKRPVRSSGRWSSRAVGGDVGRNPAIEPIGTLDQRWRTGRRRLDGRSSDRRAVTAPLSHRGPMIERMFVSSPRVMGAPCQTLRMARVHVQVERDHVEKLTRPSRRFAGISELIWNGLDAEATKVTVSLAENALGGVDQLVVTDNGHGMTNDEAHRYFATLGGSWKRTAPGRHSKSKKRVLHGSEGQGRWRAFGVGTFVTWTTVAEVDGGRQRTRIIGTLENLTDFDISEPQTTEDTPGTRVEIENIRPESQGLLGERVLEALTAEFALYLEKYAVTVVYRGTTLDPAAVQERRDEIAVEHPNAHGPVSVTVIEWKREFPRSMLLCDQEGVVLGEIAPGVQAPGFDFTVYVRWAGFRRFENELLLAELATRTSLPPSRQSVIRSARTSAAGRRTRPPSSSPTGSGNRCTPTLAKRHRRSKQSSGRSSKSSQSLQRRRSMPPLTVHLGACHYDCCARPPREVRDPSTECSKK